MDRTSYDSTWEEDESSAAQEWSTNKARETTRQLKNGKPKKFRYEYMYSTAARDMQDYRHGYHRRWANHQGDPEEMPNLHFYRNEIKFKPNGFYIEEILKTWKEDYAMLERNHNYIQWLFPLRERGVNPHATPLCEDEIKIMRNDRDVTRRLLQAYKLMLGFYGLYLKNEKTGEVCRAQNWMERYKNLNNNTHNNLRITRILKCLGELGFEHYQAPLVQFFLKETLCKDQLKNTKRSVLDYFMFSVKDKRERQNLVYFAWKYYKPQGMFVWGPVDLLRRYQDVLNEYQGEDCDTIRREHGKEDKKEPQNKNNEDDRKGNKRKQNGYREDEELNMKNKNGQGCMQERREVETLYPNSIGNGGDTIAYKMEDREEENLKCGEGNSQHGMRDYEKVDTQTHRNNSGDDRTKLEREKMKDNHIHGQQYMMNDGQAESLHHKNPQNIDNVDDKRGSKMEDREKLNVKTVEVNNQHSMREHQKVETQTNDKPQRNYGEDDRATFKWENRKDNHIHGQQHMKNDGQAKTPYHKEPQSIDNEDKRRGSKMEDREKLNVKSGVGNSQHGMREHAKLETQSNDKPQRNDSEDDRAKFKRENRKDNHIHGQQYIKNDGQAESLHHKKPQNIDNVDDRRGSKMEDREKLNVKTVEGNNQHGMREHQKVGTQSNDKPQRNYGEDDRTKFKGENREDNHIHGQQYMKNDGQAETPYHKNPQSINNEDERREQYMKNRNAGTPYNKNPQRTNNSGPRKKSRIKFWKKTKIGSEKKNSQRDIKPQGERDASYKNHVNNEKHAVLSGDESRKRARNFFCIPIHQK